MIGFDPIDLENKDVNLWLSESDDNILLLVDKNQVNFSKSPSLNKNKNKKLKEKIFCLKRQYLSIPELKNVFLKCILFNNQLLVGETHNSSQNYVNIGYLINKPILIDFKTITSALLKSRVFKLNILSENDKFINKEYLELSNIGLFKQKPLKIDKNLTAKQITEIEQNKKLNKQIEKKNLPHKKEVYFEELLAKALTDYSYQWDAPINSYLRIGEDYFSSAIFKQYHKRYGPTLDLAKAAIKNKILDLDRVFLEVAPRNEKKTVVYYRGMTRPFEFSNGAPPQHATIGESIVVPNYISISSNLSIALRFSGLPRGQRCCLYKIFLEKGVPMIDMITTSKFKSEKETLLPRNLNYTLTNIEYIDYPIFNPIFRVPVMVLTANLSNPDQFNIETRCRNFYLAKLVKSTDLDFIIKSQIDKKKNIAKDNKGKPINLDNLLIEDNTQAHHEGMSKKPRCPNGTRRNKITGICVKIDDSRDKTDKTKKNDKTDKNNKTKKKPRCPNGTRRNKTTGNCEAI